MVTDWFFTLMKAFSIMPVMPAIDRERLAAGHQVRTARHGGVEPLDRAVVNRQHVVLARLPS